MPHVLECNDWQLRLINERGEVEYDQPAAAALVAGELAFGRDAQAVARTQPQQFSGHYFNRLNADPLPARLGPARNHADLIYHHLQALQIQGPVVLCVPGHVTNAQLGLLLGIAREAGLRVMGFLDTALAYAIDADLAEPAHLLDIELHRASLTEITIDGRQRGARDCKAFDPLGAIGVIDGWLNVIADEFVQKTRFDPLHAAATEQQLLDIVSGWLATDTLAAKHVEVTTGDQTRDIEIGAEVLRSKLTQRLDAVDLLDVRHVVLTPRAQRIPGLRALLASRVELVTDADERLFVQAALRLGDRLTGDPVERIGRGESSLLHAPSAASAPALARVTHLLAAHEARSIRAPEFSDYLSADGVALNGVPVNGRPSDGSPLLPGDQVVIGKETYVAIAVH